MPGRRPQVEVRMVGSLTGTMTAVMIMLNYWSNGTMMAASMRQGL